MCSAGVWLSKPAEPHGSSLAIEYRQVANPKTSPLALASGEWLQPFLIRRQQR
jgi:hypothetical protein